MTFQLFQKQVLLFLKIEILLQILIFCVSFVFFSWGFQHIWSGAGTNRIIFIITSNLFFLLATFFSFNKIVYFACHKGLNKNIQKIIWIEIFIFILSLLNFFKCIMSSFPDFFRNIFPFYFKLDSSSTFPLMGFFLLSYAFYNLILFISFSKEVKK